MNIGIIGAGKLGLALIKVLSKDHEIKIIEKSQERIHYLNTIGLDATTHYSTLQYCKIVFILVNTATENCYQYESLIEVLKKIHKLKNKPLLVISSTCEPSFFNQPIFEKIKKYAIYNPFFVRQGSLEQDIKHPDFVLIGDNYNLSQPLCDLYKSLNIHKQLIMDCMSAAIVKLGINSYLTMKITYANLIGDLCKAYNANPDVVLQAIGEDKRINTNYFQYGFGYGGPCLPIDTIALGNALNATSLNDELPKIIKQLNNEHLQFQIREFEESGANEITIQGVGFKQDSDLLIHSQKLLFAERLARHGYSVTIKDSAKIIKQLTDIFGNLFKYEL